ncbi:hypothetical protein [Streptomyces sp. V2I9]|uniref:hypothetical protein n=1 Tax=Streptomyces sp. V2I9 TaxID=3042304 RepID=UPI0027803177|nr:hypothetical protein [Streptomyces sp. V2I9]MDQ0986563.1 hypothetical protein [Streptomyces sp. V2I9]
MNRAPAYSTGPSAPPARAGLRGIVVPAVVGSVLVSAAAVLFALLPGSLSEARAFQAARPCERVGGSAAENGDCLSTWPATVLSTEARPQGKGFARWATLDPGGDTPPFRVRLRGEHPVWEKLAPGTRVTVATWRDRAVWVEAGKERQDATDRPGPGAIVRLAVGLALLIVGGALLRASAGAHRRRATGAPAARASRIVVPTAATALAVGVAVTAAVLVENVLLALLLAAAGCAAAWAASAWLLRRPARRRTA